MSKLIIRLIVLASVSVLLIFISGNKETINNYLSLEKTILLPGVSGRIDHMAYNPSKNELYIASLGNNSIEIVSIAEGKVINEITGFDEPQGIVFLPEKNCIFVTNGGSGLCQAINEEDLNVISNIKLAGDADNIRYIAPDKLLYVGYGNGGIAVIDATNFRLIKQIQLSGHPESFQLSKKEDRIFVNIPGRNQIQVIDIKNNSVTDRWELTRAKSNYPMCLDEENHRLFIGCRNPAKMLVYDYNTAKLVAEVNIDGDIDDIFLDGNSKRLYLSCGSGYIDIIQQISADNYTLLDKFQTRKGARTCLMINSSGKLLVACPSINNSEAKLLIFSYKSN